MMRCIVIVLTLGFLAISPAFASQYEVAASAVRIALHFDETTPEFEAALAENLQDPVLQERIVSVFRQYMKTEGYSDLHVLLTPILKKVIFGLSANTHRELKARFWIHDPKFHVYLADRLREATQNPKTTEDEVPAELRAALASLHRRAVSVKKEFIIHNGMNHPVFRRLVLKMLKCDSLLENP